MNRQGGFLQVSNPLVRVFTLSVRKAQRLAVEQSFLFTQLNGHPYCLYKALWIGNIPTGDVEGGTDGGIIHKHKSGVPSLTISMPLRHIHSHCAVMHRDDFDHTVELLTSVLQQLDEKTVAELTEW